MLSTPCFPRTSHRKLLLRLPLLQSGQVLSQFSILFFCVLPAARRPIYCILLFYVQLCFFLLGKAAGLDRRNPQTSLSEGGLGLRASSQSLVYNPGSRVATLVVSKGVMGFLGDLRGRNSKSPPNPLGLAERVHRPQTMIPPRSPTPHSSCEFGFFFICFICPKHMMFVSKTIRSPSGECRDNRHVFSSNQRILKL